MEIVLLNIKNFAVFAVFLGVLITVHEWGHFITAKRLGVNVQKFSIGFGPKILSFSFNNTEYLVSLFPLGGYVKMEGEIKEECKGNKGEFYAQSPGRRSLIVINGPIVNILLAYICLVFVFMLGYPDLSNRLGKIYENYPAKEAGLIEGDRIVGINSQPVENWTQLKSGIADSTGSSINLTILRDGVTIQKEIFPKIEKRKNIFGEEKETRMIGVVPAEEIVTLKYGVGESFVKGFEELIRIVSMTCKAIYSMVVGSMSVKENIGGPVFIFSIVASAAEKGLNHFLFILGAISANLAIFNLLPILPLDGGHILLFGVEKVRGRPLPVKVDEYFARIGLSLIILLALFTFYVDFDRLGFFEKIKQLFF